MSTTIGAPADVPGTPGAPSPAEPSAEGAGGRLAVLMITAFVDMVGLLMVIPLLPFYAKELGGNGFTFQVLGGTYHFGIGQIVAFLVSSYTIAQLIAAPAWGRFSDRFGRRPALMIALSASAIAYVIFGYATSLLVLFLSRLVQGAGGGTTGVVQAYVADATRPEDRAKSLGWLSAATNAGVALGPVIGAWAQRLGREAPGLFAAALCVINVIFCWRFLRETRDVAAAKARPKRPGASRAAVARVISHSTEPASRLIWIYAIAIGAFQGVTSLLALFLAARYAVTKNTIGYFFAYVGVISVLARALVLGRMVDRFGEPRLARLGLIMLALGLATMPLTRNYWQLAASVALMPLGTAFTFPCVSAMLTRVISADERGLYMGVQQTFGGAARAIFPLLFGFAFDRLGVGAPFWIAAILVMGTVFLGLDMETYVAKRVRAA